jgi:hypothetical protein
MTDILSLNKLLELVYVQPSSSEGLPTVAGGCGYREWDNMTEVEVRIRGRW